MANARKIVFISDTHGHHKDIEIPDGDILIHGGDFTNRGDLESLTEFNSFLGTLSHPHKIVIAGNHDFCFQRQSMAAREALSNATYLEDSSIEIEGLTIYGSPWQPWFHDWAFNLRPGRELKEKWDLIPDNTDILVTHGPPHGICDHTMSGHKAGCEELHKAISRIKPRFHLFGHIHEAYGCHKTETTTFINGSNCDFHYQPTNPAVTFTI